MKKLTSILLALLTLTAVSCSSGSSSSVPESSIAETVNVTQTAYMETVIPLEHPVERALKMAVWGDECHFFYIGDGEMRRAVIAADNTVTSDISMGEIFNSGMGYSVSVKDDGGFYAVYPVTDFVFEKDDYGRITNYGDFIINGEFSLYFGDFDSTGNKLSETELVGLRREFSKSQSNLRGLYPYGDGQLILSIGNALALIGTDGEFIDCTHYDDKLFDLGMDSDGNVIVSNWFNYGIMDGTTLNIPDVLFDDPEELDSFSSDIIPGIGGFKKFAAHNDGIYGFTADDEKILVMSFANSFVNTEEISVCAPRSDGEFIGAGSNNESVVRVFTRRADDYNSDRETVVIWQIDGGDGGAEAKGFNKSNDRFIAEIPSNLKTMEELSRAILVDEGPDVADCHGRVVTELLNMGALADMAPMFEEYDGLKREDIMPNVLKAFDMDGKIYALPEYFNVEMFAANKNIIDSEDGTWTIQQMMDTYHSLPEGTLFSNSFGTNPFDSFVRFNYEMWIDKEKNVSKFNTPEFVEFLKFCRETKDSRYFDQWERDEVEYAEYYQRSFTSLKDGSVMLNLFDDRSTMGLSFINQSICGKGVTLDDVSLLNLPDGEKSGVMDMGNTFCILSNSKCREGAWAYISYILSEEHGNRWGMALNFTNKKAFENQLAKYVQENSTPRTEKSSHWLSSGAVLDCSYELSITQEQADRYRDFVLNCTRLHTPSESVDSILLEEYDRYLNDEITAEECAEIIGNRVDIYVSEKS